MHKPFSKRGQTKDAQVTHIGDEGLQYAQSVNFRKGRYLVRVVAYQSTSETSEALLALAHGIEAKLLRRAFMGTFVVIF